MINLNFIITTIVACFPIALLSQPYTPLGFDHLPLSGGGGWRAIPLDVDQDGDQDILQLRSHQPDAIFLNDGQGFFTKIENEQAWQIPGGSFDAATADFNNDGKVDLVVGRGPASGGSAMLDGHDMLLIANGDGTFWDAGNNLKSAASATCILPLDLSKTNYSMGVAVADFDKDGRPDIAFANGGLIFQPILHPLEPFNGQWLLCPQYRNQALRNQLFLARPDADPADGVYDYEDVSEQAGIGLVPNVSTGVVAADFNGDGWDDLFFTTFSFQPITGVLGLEGQTCELFLNDPGQPANFMKSEGFPSISLRASGVAAADFDKDGDVDLLISTDASSGASQPLLFLNDGAGNFSEAPQNTVPFLPSGCMRRMYVPKFEDLNNDGWVDIFLAGIQSAFFIQDSLTHTFSVATNLLPLQGAVGRPNTFNSYGAALADYDGNGETDIFLSDTYEQPRLWLQSGGTFVDLTARNLSPDGENNSWLTAIDFDKDGDMDLVGAVDGNCSMSQSIHLQTGLGPDGLPVFEEASGLLPDEGNVRDNFVMAHDFDGDGLEDLLFAERTTSVRIYKALGGANYQEVTSQWWPAFYPLPNKVVKMHLKEGSLKAYFFIATGYDFQHLKKNLLMTWDEASQKLTQLDWLPEQEDICLDATVVEDLNGDSWPEIVIATWDKGTLMYLSSNPSSAADPGYVLVHPDGFLDKNSAAVLGFGTGVVEFSKEEGIFQPHRYHPFTGLDSVGIPQYETIAFGEPVNGNPVATTGEFGALSPQVFLVADHASLRMYQIQPFLGIIENISDEWLDVDGGDGFGLFAKGISLADLNDDGSPEILIARDDQDLILYDKQVLSATTEALNSAAPQLVVFPNPTSGFLNIYCEGEQFRFGAEVCVEVWNIAGMRIFSERYRWTEKGVQLLLPGQVVSGIYFLKISSQEKVKASRFVVK